MIDHRAGGRDAYAYQMRCNCENVECSHLARRIERSTVAVATHHVQSVCDVCSNGENNMTDVADAMMERSTASTSSDLLNGDEEVATLDLSLLGVGGVTGKVLEAATQTAKYARALADVFGKRIRETGVPITLEYPVRLPVEIQETAFNQATGEPAHMERSAVKKWLDENVPLGDDKYTWSIVPNGRPDSIIVKIIKKRAGRVARS